jgi:hypothetical protein
MRPWRSLEALSAPRGWRRAAPGAASHSGLHLTAKRDDELSSPGGPHPSHAPAAPRAPRPPPRQWWLAENGPVPACRRRPAPPGHRLLGQWRRCPGPPWLAIFHPKARAGCLASCVPAFPACQKQTLQDPCVPTERETRLKSGVLRSQGERTVPRARARDRRVEGAMTAAWCRIKAILECPGVLASPAPPAAGWGG